MIYPKILMIVMIAWNMGFEIKHMTERDGMLGTSIAAAIVRAGAISCVLWWGGFWAAA